MAQGGGLQLGFQVNGEFFDPIPHRDPAYSQTSGSFRLIAVAFPEKFQKTFPLAILVSDFPGRRVP